MPSPDRESRQIVVAGASSLLGAELKALLEESRFAGWEIHLVDEESAAGTLTEAAGEPAVIQTVDEATFQGARFVFFTGSPEFTRANLAKARDAGATVLDLSGGALAEARGLAWFSFRGVPARDMPLFVIPSAASTIAGHLLDALGRSGLYRLSVTFFRPVSDAGRPGIEELETQTTQLLSFQNTGQPVFNAQIAFSLLNCYGPSSRQNLAAVRESIRREIAAAAGNDLVQPSIQVLHAPVFYGCAFSALAEINSGANQEQLAEHLKKTGMLVAEDPKAPLGNLTPSGDSKIHVAAPAQDTAQPGTWWLWGAADNVRLPAANAVQLAEMLL